MPVKYFIAVYSAALKIVGANLFAHLLHIPKLSIALTRRV
jgi:hypothetical protein